MTLPPSDDADAADMAIRSPAAQDQLFGHHAAEQALVRALTGGRMHHAWLITGPRGIGKATLAFRCARYMLASGVADTVQTLATNPADPAVQRVIAGSHGDLLLIERGFDDKRQRERQELPVDQVRRIAPFMQSTSSEGGWRVVIVDDADTMNRAAQNALLKILEEPPARAVLFMLSDHPDRLLPTIRSRCRRLALAPLDPVTLHQAVDSLAGHPVDGGLLAEIGELAQGAPGQVLDLIELGVAEFWLSLQDCLEARRPREREKLAKQLAGDPRKWQLFGNLLRLWLRRRADGIAVGQLDPLFALWDKAGQQLQQADHRNLDHALVAQMLLERFSRAA